MAENEIGDKDVTLLEGHRTRQEAKVEDTVREKKKVKNTYHISIRVDGARKAASIDKVTSFKSRREALGHVMTLVDVDRGGRITGSTIYRQKYESWPTWTYDEAGKAVDVQERFVPTFLDPVLSMKRDGGTVRWRDVSSHPDAAYLRDYERG